MSTVFVTERLATGVEVGVVGGQGSTQIETLELLFAVFESVSAEDSATVAVFVTVVLAVTVFAVAVIVRVALSPFDNVPTFQLPVELE